MSKTDFVGSVSKTPKSCHALSILSLYWVISGAGEPLVLTGIVV